MSVKPPTGTGTVRLVVIGEGGAVDLQPCGGTHVEAHRRDRPGRRHQDREEGQAEPAHPRLVRLNGSERQDTGENAWPMRANGWSRPTGWPRTSTRRTSSSSMAPCTCRPPSATPRPSTWPSTSPARCSSTSTTSPTRPRRCRTCCRRPSKFASRMKKMGIGDGMHVVVYDSEGLYSAARVWWMFRVMGHEDVRGPQRRPQEMEGRGPSAGGRRAAPAHASATSPPRFNAELVRDVGDVKALIGSKAAQIVDARAAARFEGTRARAAPGPALRPHPGLAQRALRLAAQSRRHPEAAPPSCARSSPSAGVDPAKPVVASCGSGVTAGVIALASPCSAAPTPPSTTAPGPNGAAIRPADRDRARRSSWLSSRAERNALYPLGQQRSGSHRWSSLRSPQLRIRLHGMAASAVQRPQHLVEAGRGRSATAPGRRRSAARRSMMARPFSSSSRASPGLLDRLERADLVVADRQVALPAGMARDRAWPAPRRSPARGGS